MKKKRIQIGWILLILVLLVLSAYFNKKNKSPVERKENDLNRPNDEIRVEDETSQITAFYTEDITKNYAKITQLSPKYTVQQAAKENCFVIANAKSYNEHLYEEFMEQYKKKESTFLRLVNLTIEGEPILCDIKYDSQTNKVTLLMDTTRDTYAASSDRTISLKEYDKIGVYSYRNNLFWLAYTGELNDALFNSPNVAILAIIN